MTNEYGEYLNYKIKYNSSNNPKERAYYESLSTLSGNSEGQPVNPTAQSDAYVPINSNGDGKIIGYQNIQPTTVDNDEDLQSALNGEPTENPQGNRDLNLNGKEWGGMESGAVQYNSTQSPNWLGTVPDAYRDKALAWSANQGILEIIPVQQRQKFTYSTVAYIAKHTIEPKTQRIPISDVSVTPHQINFDFYDTTEGRIGVSNATEKHMSVEFDVYLTDYVFFNWNSGGDNENKYYMDIPDFIKKTFWNAVEEEVYIYDGLFTDYEQTKEFSDFRSSFLQQHLGWICKFNTHAFPTFVGVINDVSFSINNGESFAKWHVKLEEAIFTEAYSTTGQKPSETSEDASQTDSGAAENTEEVQTGEQ